MSNVKAAGRKKRDAERSLPATASGSPWEWVLAALGLLLIGGAIGYMAYSGLTMRAEPPQIAVTRDSVESNGDGYLVMIRVVNRGASTAASLKVEGTLSRDDGSTLETSDVTIDYVPRSSERKAGLFFSNDPSRYRLELRPVAYTEP